MTIVIDPRYRHDWQLSPREAIATQTRLRGDVETVDRLGEVRTVAGIDVGFEDGGRITRAAVVVLSVPELKPVALAVARRDTCFPYVPGLLSFREIPAVLAVLEKLERLPDLILCDGQGIAHPRRLGIASHLGLLLDVPTIGIGKSRLCGQHGRVPEQRGAWTALVDKQETIGAVLRTRAGVKSVYVSSGHRISLDTAVHWALCCTTRYRLPETTRWAHRIASETPQQVRRALHKVGASELLRDYVERR